MNTKTPIVTDRGDWLQTYTGVMFHPMDPRPEEINIEDIAHALSLLCRFGGHVKRFYSVAQHSIGVMQLVPQHLKLTALLHDATEAYLVDVPRPIKRSLPQYKAIETRLAGVIAQRFWHSFEPIQFDHPAIHEADNRMLVSEARDLMRTPPAPWGYGLAMVEPIPDQILTWPPEVAKASFLSCYNTLTATRHD